MLFLDYEMEKIKYYEALERCGEILSEKERLFSKTQPKAVQYDKEKISTSNQGNVFDDYVIEKERKRIDERLRDAQDVVKDRKFLLEQKEQQLRKSKDIQDVIYTYKVLEGMSAYQIGADIGYSKSQIYREIEEIEKIIKNGTKRDIMGQNGTKSE